MKMIPLGAVRPSAFYVGRGPACFVYRFLLNAIFSNAERSQAFSKADDVQFPVSRQGHGQLALDGSAQLEFRVKILPSFVI